MYFLIEIVKQTKSSHDRPDAAWIRILATFSVFRNYVVIFTHFLNFTIFQDFFTTLDKVISCLTGEWTL